MVVPGSYLLRLRAGAWAQERPLIVRADPRVGRDGITPSVLQQQERFNLEARDLVTATRRLVANLQGTRRRLEGSPGVAPDTLTRLQQLERVLVPSSVRYSEPALLTHITYLYSMSIQADQPISRDARQRLAALQQELRTAQARAPR